MKKDTGIDLVKLRRENPDIVIDKDGSDMEISRPEHYMLADGSTFTCVTESDQDTIFEICKSHAPHVIQEVVSSFRVGPLSIVTGAGNLAIDPRGHRDDDLDFEREDGEVDLEMRADRLHCLGLCIMAMGRFPGHPAMLGFRRFVFRELDFWTKGKGDTFDPAHGVEPESQPETLPEPEIPSEG